MFVCVCAARAPGAALSKSRVTLHRFTFHLARNRLRIFYAISVAGKGRREAGVFYARPRPGSFAYGPPALVPLASLTRAVYTHERCRAIAR